jgi:hypothetical protein
MLPTDHAERKAIPVYSGFICYFPLAIAEVAKHSQESNEQHNPGQPMHWNRAKSKDERDAQARHLLDQAAPQITLDEEIEHAKAGAWRAMANLQKLCEKRDGEYATGSDAEGYSIYRCGEFVGHLDGEFNNNPQEALEYFLGIGHGPDVENSKSQKIAVTNDGPPPRRPDESIIEYLDRTELRLSDIDESLR